MLKYTDCIQYIPDLENYIKQKIKTDEYKDVLQDTLLYIHNNFETHKITNLKGFILNTGRFFILKYFKVRNKKYIACDTVLELNKANIKVNSYNSINIDDKLLHCLNSIDDKYLKPLQLQLMGYTINEISDELDINTNTIKTRISRCKVKMKEVYENYSKKHI